MKRNYITMIPDSTQDVRKELAPTSRTAKERNISMAKDMKGKKRKSKELLKKKGTKRKKAEQTRATESPGCDAAEMDLQVELKPISDYVGDRTELVEQMMTTITMPQIRRMLPDILKDIPGDKLKQLCNDQLDMMSKKRILCILKGENADDISSSGTDDGDDEDVKEPGQEQDSVQPADSTSSLLDEPHSAEKKLSTTNDNDQLELNPDQDEVGSLYDEEMDRSVAAKDVELNADTPKEAEVEKLDVKPEKEIPSHHQEEERIPRHLPTTAPPTTEAASLGHAALSSFTKNQMEILELEMRARAIKAMLNAQVRQPGTPQSQPQEQKVEEEVEQEEWDEDEEQEDIAYRIDDQCQARKQEEDEVIAKPLSPPAPVVTRYKRGVDSEPEEGELTDQSEDDGEQVDDNVESNKPESTIQVSSPTKVEERQIKREGDPAVALSAADASAIVTAPADSTRSGSLPAVTSSDDGEERAIGETLCALVDAVAASIDCHRVAETNADDGAGACSTHAAIARGSSMRAPCSHDPSHKHAVRVEAVSTRQNAGQDGSDGRQAGSDAVQAGSDTVQAGSDTVQAGSDAVQAGSDAVQAGSDTVQAGSDAVQAGSDTVRAGSDAVQAGNDTVQAGSEKDGDSGHKVVRSSSQCGQDDRRLHTHSHTGSKAIPVRAVEHAEESDADDLDPGFWGQGTITDEQELDAEESGADSS